MLEPAATVQQAATQQAQLGQVEQMVRGVGEAIGEALARWIREDAIDAKILGRPPPLWDGSPELWPSWSMRVESFAKRLGAAEEMPQAITGDAHELHLRNFSAEAAQRSQKLFDLFVDTLHGRAALTLRVCEKGNGFQVWSRLHKGFQAKSASRFQSMLSAIMHPE